MASDKLTKKNFKKIRINKYEYKSLNTDSHHFITLNVPQSVQNCFCTCKDFMKKAVCIHLIALQNLFDLINASADFDGWYRPNVTEMQFRRMPLVCFLHLINYFGKICMALNKIGQ